MNTSDRSIAPLDSALRRRFGFIRVEPLTGQQLRARIIDANGQGAADRISRSIDQLTNLNEVLRECLGPDAMLGHSYLFDVNATEGTLGDSNDPLAALRETVSEGNVTGVTWLEARVLDGGSANQLNLPDFDQPSSRQGIVDALYPMSSGGKRTDVRSPRGAHDKVEILYNGKRYLDNVVRFNSGGPNYKLYYLGQTTDGERFSTLTGTRLFNHKVHVWLRREDSTFELILLDRSESVLAALRGASSGPQGWHERTSGGKGRSYGVVDMAQLGSHQDDAVNDASEDAEWMIWRYAILPQLVDTVTQVGATDLLTPDTRTSWLESANVIDTADRWSEFDQFLTSLSLAIKEEGYGLTRGLTVVDLPVGVVGRYAPIAGADQDEEDGTVPDQP